jgi:hypothetical protein
MLDGLPTPALQTKNVHGAVWRKVMPFDSGAVLLAKPPLVNNPLALPKVDRLVALYRERREAASGMWLTVSRANFTLDDWGDECGTFGCALGWLAHWQHDGWYWAPRTKRGADLEPKWDDDIYPIAPQTRGKPYTRAAWYFGLMWGDAIRCFGADQSEVFYGKPRALVTTTDVVTKLFDSPYQLYPTQA